MSVVEDYCKWCVQSKGQSADVGLREPLNRRDAYLMKGKGHAPAPEGKATHGFPARAGRTLLLQRPEEAKIARQPRGSRECRLGGHDVMAAPHTTIANFKRVMTGKGKPDVLAAINYLGLKGIFVEVGTFRGNFAEQICRFTRCEKLYCVDPYRSYDDFRDRINDLDLGAIFETTKKRLSPFGERVSFVRDFSEKGADTFAAETLDLVYIDANHQREFVTRDLVAWYPKVRSGGLLCGDDVVDLAEDQRDNQGNVKIVWQRDEYGKPIAWGTYGVFAAVRDFAKQNELEYFISGTQFFFIKP